MGKTYSKEDIIGAYLFRFIECDLAEETLSKLEQNANKYYDEVGKTEFRKYASVDVDAIKKYLEAI